MAAATSALLTARNYTPERLRRTLRWNVRCRWRISVPPRANGSPRRSPTDRRSGPGLAGDRLRRARPDLRADRLWQDAGRIHVGDRPARARAPGEPREGISLVYVSPLKALSYDIDRNLRAPLRGIGADLEVAVRTGDTPQKERQAMLRKPPDILITTPESLYLMLTGRAQELFAGTRWCIIDEIHAVAATKRGSHLALTLERLSRAAEKRRSADRAVRDAESARGGRPLHGRPPAQLPDRRHWRAQGTRPEDPRARRIDGRARRDAVAGARSAGRRRGHAPLDLAGYLPGAAAADQAAPLDDPVRQQPPRRRTARAAL